MYPGVDFANSHMVDLSCVLILVAKQSVMSQYKSLAILWQLIWRSILALCEIGPLFPQNVTFVAT